MRNSYYNSFKDEYISKINSYSLLCMCINFKINIFSNKQTFHMHITIMKIKIHKIKIHKK